MNKQRQRGAARTSVLMLVLFLMAAMGIGSAASVPAGKHVLSSAEGGFLMDGKPFQIISGEIHYARIPHQYWRDRLRKARAMGLNTISTYVFWNFHEATRGVYDFTGDRDVAEFIRIAQQEGLFVILRPGPYVCAEWELGGYPAWLLADPEMLLRSNQPQYMAAVTTWMTRLGQELAPLQAARGGPIIAVQVENEYGSFDDDKQYLEAMRTLVVKAGFNQSLLYTADGATQLPSGTLPGLQAVVNYGPGEARTSFKALAAFEPGKPLMTGEYWAGWFDHWGAKHETTDPKVQVEELGWMLSQNYSVNLYMFHGGTDFDLMNGANYSKGYEPDTTSYDYDAALDEAGNPTPKFIAFRDVIAARTHEALPPVPAPQRTIAIPTIRLTEATSLWKNLPAPIASLDVKPMEMFGEAYGSILYRTHVHGPREGELVVERVHDYAAIYVNSVLAGTLDRRVGQDHLTVKLSAADNVLDILVENQGRINYTKALRGERKGITEQVLLNEEPLHDWQVFPLPMSPLMPLRFDHFSPAASPTRRVDGPAFFHASFQVDAVGDTFLDTSGLGKGIAFLNGRTLGRFWQIGPQRTLYVPGPWLRKGKNEITIYAYQRPASLTLHTLSAPILDDMSMAATTQKAQ